MNADLSPPIAPRPPELPHSSWGLSCQGPHSALIPTQIVDPSQLRQIIVKVLHDIIGDHVHNGESGVLAASKDLAAIFTYFLAANEHFRTLVEDRDTRIIELDTKKQEEENDRIQAQDELAELNLELEALKIHNDELTKSQESLRTELQTQSEYVRKLESLVDTI